MSRAGKFSSRGDEYQLQIGLHWLINLLSDQSIDFIQIELTGIPDLEIPITVDDVIVFFKNKHIKFIQAKKNCPQHKYWTINLLLDEFKKAFQQIQVCSNCSIVFYSQSPWGEVEQLVEVLELLVDVIEGKTDKSDLHLRSEDIATTFVQRLREADELNDSGLLRRGNFNRSK